MNATTMPLRKPVGTDKGGVTLELVNLEDLAVDPRMQVRGAGTDPGLVKQYKRAMEAGEVFPPLRVAKVAGVPVLVDGFHRVAALGALGKGSFEAEVVEVGTLEEARWLAAEANLRHGARLKAKDKGEVLRAYVAAGHHKRNARGRGGYKTYREMAADLPGLSYSDIRRRMNSEFPSIYRALARGRDDWRGAKGGLPDPEDPSMVFARQAAEALRLARSCAPGVTSPEDRYRLMELVREIAEALEGAGLEKPDF